MEHQRRAVSTAIIAAVVIVIVVVVAIGGYWASITTQSAPISTTTTTTTITKTITTQPNTSQITITSSPPPFPDNGSILIGNTGYFAYTRIAISSGVPIVSTQILQNVTFTYVTPNATMGGYCNIFKVNFTVDGSSENLVA